MRVLCAGSFMVEIVAAHLPSIPGPGGLVYAPRGIVATVGGHAANVSIDLARLGQEGVAAAGCIGDDPLGRFVEGLLRSEGVDARPEYSSSGTAKDMSLTVEGEDRRFVAELAANTMLSPGHVKGLLSERPSVLYMGTVGGLRLIDPTLRGVLAAAHAAGAATFVDVIPPTDPGWSHLIPALPKVDVLHCNEREARSITSKGPEDAARALIRLGANTTVISLGAGGLVAAGRDVLLSMPAFRVDEVDATGAGDALCAGIIRSLLSVGADPREPTLDQLREALLWGQATGAACVTLPGATAGITLERVTALVEEQGRKVREQTRTRTL